MGKRMSFETAEYLARKGKSDNDNDSIFITGAGNKYGYKVNVNHPQVQPLYEQFKKKLKTPILSDRERFQFESIIISKFSKDKESAYTEETDVRNSCSDRGNAD